MFSNPGSKIKKYALVVTIIGFVMALIGAISMWVAATQFYYVNGVMVFAGFLIMGIGAVAAYLSGLFVYGLGQLIEDNQFMASHFRRKE